MSSPNLALAFAFSEYAVYKEIFGELMTQLVIDDVFKELSIIMQQLLERHEVTERYVLQEEGICYAIFTPGDDSVLMDNDEQAQAILFSGQRMIRESLNKQLGTGSGRQIEFSLAFVSLDKVEDIDYSNAQIKQALKDTENQKVGVVYAEKSTSADITKREFLSLLEKKAIETHFQPIVELSSGKTVGYEALTRGLSGSPVRRADQLFGSASYFGLSNQLEFICIESALNWVPKVPEFAWVAINIGPKLLVSEEFLNLIRRDEYKPFLPRIVFELTEHLPLANAKSIKQTIVLLNKMGVRLSLDDTGCGFFDLHTVEELRPSIVKLCITVIKRLDRKEEVAEEIRAIRQRIDQLGGVTLSEGVETEEQRKVLQNCGIQLAQGYLFSKPKPAKELF